ncbi:MAG: chemotaxis protein CheW [Thermodesulfovibrionales bacterium]|jgi:purine-binding chemotaxis protein CheW
MKKIAVILVGKEEFGIDIGKLVEILGEQRIFHLPHLPSFFSGVINVRGDVIPLVDLRVRFGIHSVSLKERVVVVRLGGEKVGLLVDGVRDIIDLQPEEEVKTPSMVKGLRAEYLTGLAKKGDRIIVLLNIEAVLTSEERLQFEEVRKTIGVDHAGDTKTSQ